MLDDFGKAATKLSIGERAQQVWIGKHQFWRKECANQIFSLGKIHASLSTNGAVHLSNEGCGNVGEFHSAQVRGRGKPGYVTNHSASHRNDERLTIGTRATQGARDQFHAAKIFGG